MPGQPLGAGVQAPPPRPRLSGPASHQAFDDFIFAFFAVEMIIKMVALGLFGQKCYLGDTWNRLDFFIVMAGYGPPGPQSSGCPAVAPVPDRARLGAPGAHQEGGWAVPSAGAPSKA